MELKHYAAIIWKRAWIPAILIVIVVVATIMTRHPPPPIYTTTLRFNVAVTPEQANEQYNFNGLHAWVTSEYMADTLSVLVSGQEFAAYINKNLIEAGSSVSVSANLISAETEHRVLTLSLTWGNQAELTDISRAITKAVEENSLKYFPQVDQFGARVTLIDILGPTAISQTSRTQQLEVPVRVVLALGVGLALTFLLDYLDDSVRNRSELEEMGIVVLAEVPNISRRKALPEK